MLYGNLHRSTRDGETAFAFAVMVPVLYRLPRDGITPPIDGCNRSLVIGASEVHLAKSESEVIIWNGWGIVILAIPVALAIATQLAVEAIYGPGSFTEGLRLYWLIIGALAAVITWPIGSAMNKNGNAHRLFFIPVQFWAPIWALGGLVIFFGMVV